MARKFAVIGVGKYGAEIARELAKKGAEVHAFDVSQARTEALKDEVALAIALILVLVVAQSSVFRAPRKKRLKLRFRNGQKRLKLSLRAKN